MSLLAEAHIEAVAEHSNSKQELFSRIYGEYESSVRRYIVRRIRCPHATEDVIQQVWLNVFEAIETTPTGTNALWWLMTIARHATINHWRKNSRLEKMGFTGIGGESTIDGVQQDDPSVGLRSDEQSAELVSAIQQLGEREQMILLLRLQEVSDQEIGIKVGLEAERVKERAFRAIGHLKQIFYQHGLLTMLNGATPTGGDFRSASTRWEALV